MTSFFVPEIFDAAQYLYYIYKTRICQVFLLRDESVKHLIEFIVDAAYIFMI